MSAKKNIIYLNTETNNDQLDTINLDPNNRIKEYMDELRFKEECHNCAFLYYKKKYERIDMFNAIILTFMTTSLGVNYFGGECSEGKNDYISLVGTLVCFLTASLTIYKQLDNMVIKASGHDANGKSFGDLLTFLEIQLSGEPLNSKEKISLVKEIATKIIIIEKYELTIPSNIEKEIDKKNKLIKRNGLEYSELKEIEKIVNLRKKKEKNINTSRPDYKIVIANDIKEENPCPFKNKEYDNSISSNSDNDKESKKILYHDNII